MTYLVENEQAALMIPARMLARLHPHYREVMQLLAARRRTGLHPRPPSCCRCSARGSFLDLLRFIQRHAPDRATADVTILAGRDEARHVAFGVAHSAHVVRSDPGTYLARLRDAVERRHSVLVDTAGLNKPLFNSLVVLAAGSWTPAAIARGWHEVQHLQQAMDEGRQRRLEFIGFPADEAAAISALHTRNFM